MGQTSQCAARNGGSPDGRPDTDGTESGTVRNAIVRVIADDTAGAADAAAMMPKPRNGSRKCLCGRNDDVAVRWHDGEVVGTFGYRRLTILGHLSYLLPAAGSLAVLMVIPSGPWADARVTLASPALEAPFIWAAISMVASAAALVAVLRLVAQASLAAPVLKSAEEVLPSRWSCISTLSGRIKLHMLRWPELPEAERLAPPPLERPSGSAPGGTALGGAPLDVYSCHGFGASGLSFEGLLPRLPEALAPCRAVLCPDQVGFGLSDRPPLPLHRRPRLVRGVQEAADPEQQADPQDAVSRLLPEDLYSLKANAVMGGQLLQQLEGSEEPTCPLLLIGHSLGCVTTSDIAIEQARRGRDVTLVLVSPGFLFTAAPPEAAADAKKPPYRPSYLYLLLLRVLRWWLRLLIQMPGLVYCRRFWERGLKVAAYAHAGHHGERFAVEVLKYRWPTLCKDWARGLVNFLMWHLLKGFEIREVLRNLIDTLQPGSATEGRLRVLVITGTGDHVTRLYNSLRIRSCLGCPLVEVVGLGHNAHEEDPETFIRVLVDFVRRGETRRQ